MLEGNDTDFVVVILLLRSVIRSNQTGIYLFFFSSESNLSRSLSELDKTVVKLSSDLVIN